MVRTIVKKELIDGSIYLELAGLSTDSKPTDAGIATGSKFLEVNTGKTFYFNEAAADTKWVDPTAS